MKLGPNDFKNSSLINRPSDDQEASTLRMRWSQQVLVKNLAKAIIAAGAVIMLVKIISLFK